jgi:hypothetical protein
VYFAFGCCTLPYGCFDRLNHHDAFGCCTLPYGGFDRLNHRDGLGVKAVRLGVKWKVKFAEGVFIS